MHFYSSVEYDMTIIVEADTYTDDSDDLSHCKHQIISSVNNKNIKTKKELKSYEDFTKLDQRGPGVYNTGVTQI